MNEPTNLTPEKVRQFLKTRYAEPIKAKGLDPAKVPDSFDFFLEGVVDSLGILEMVTALETEFGAGLDMAGLDAEKMTILGPLADYVAANAKPGQKG